MKKHEKQELRSKKYKDLQKEMQKTETELMRLETASLRFNGTSSRIRNYPIIGQEGKWGNIKKLKKKVAFMNMLLLEKSREYV